MKSKLIRGLSLSIVCALTLSLWSCMEKESQEVTSPPISQEKPPEADKPKVPDKEEVPEEKPPVINTKPEEQPKEEKPITPSDTNVDNTTTSWWFKPNKDGKVPGINTSLKYSLKDYNAIYTGDTSKKVLYLTMDEGYENGYTAKILDILKSNNVKATFFVTMPYLKSQPDLVKRMVNEGHVVGNHSNTHPSMPDKTSDIQSFNNELTSVETLFESITGKKMIKLFRPPKGEYSQKSLAMTKNLGYTSVFWSFAYADWDTAKQPDPTYAKQKILQGLHPGGILLLHAVSKTNTEILDSIIKEARAMGYEFELLPN